MSEPAPVTVQYVQQRLNEQTGVYVDYESIASAFYAEVAAQANVCRPSDFTTLSSHPLGEALVRRVARALAMRNHPLGVVIDEAGATRLGFTDPEIRRLEGPYRKTPVG